MKNLVFVSASIVALAGQLFAASERDLRVGRAFHAFEHLGDIGEQAEVAAASGVNIIYATGLGGVGYSGLPTGDELEAKKKSVVAYNKSARKYGIRVVLGYVCATSIVKLEKFDANWSPEFRRQFKSPPAEWRQQGRDGKPLPSWYGGDYHPACMNNPDWRAYEKFVVRQQLTTHHDGIFFDNPTVHPKGCYCKFCMEKFASYLREAGVNVNDSSIDALRQLADQHPAHFLRFRCTTARDFMAEIRRFARTVKSGALITCNNSLNSPDALFSQARTYGYNIFEKSKTEDLVVVEDMSHQPRLLANGSTMEYGPTYRQLAAINHGKPIVAVTLAEGDYHTPPNLVRLAMAEAAAHQASYLAWPTWAKEQRTRMAEAILSQAQFLSKHEDLLNGPSPRTDVLLLLPMDQYTRTNRCTASELAATLTKRNIQYGVVAEDDFVATVKHVTTKKKSRSNPPTLVIEARNVPTPEQAEAITTYEKASGKVVFADQKGWETSLPTSVTFYDAPNMRATVYDESRRSIVHLYNLGIERLSSYEDRVHSVTNCALRIRVTFDKARTVTALTADKAATSGKLPFTMERTAGETAVRVRLPKLDIGTILVITR